MTDDPANAAFYFVINVAAHGYVIQYGDQGVSPEFVAKGKAIVVSFNKKIAQALASPAEAGFRLLGEATAEYQFNVPEF